MAEMTEVETMKTVPVETATGHDSVVEEEEEEAVVCEKGHTSSSTMPDLRSSRPGLCRSESDIRLVEALCSDDGLVRKDTQLTDAKFYLRFFLTFGPIGAGVTLYWRGMWTVLDTYLYPDNSLQSAWASLWIGIGTGVICHLVSVYSRSKSASRDHFFWYGLQERLFSFLVAFGAVNYWRGVWLLWDGLVLTDDPVLQNWLSLIVGTCLLYGLRSFRSVFAPPMVYMPDDADDFDGLTLELCDDLWFAPATVMQQRKSLSQTHFLRVASLLEWKRAQQSNGIQMISRKLKNKRTSLESA
jgi:hypothetical protein